MQFFFCKKKMTMNASVFFALLNSFLSCLSVTLFFRHCGIFRYPFSSVIILLINAYIPYIMSIGILPYDIINVNGTKSTKIILYKAFETFFWFSNIMAFIVAPIVAQFLCYSKIISLSQRIMKAIKFNILFYLGILVLTAVCFAILIFFFHFDLNSLPSLIIALTNAYGLLLYCFFMGPGLILFPKMLWEHSFAYKKYHYLLQNITHEDQSLQKAVSNGNKVLGIALEAGEKSAGDALNFFKSQVYLKMTKLSRLLLEYGNYLEIDFCKSDVKSLLKVDWTIATISDMENLFIALDQAFESLVQNDKYLVTLCSNAYHTLEDMLKIQNGEKLIKLKYFFIRFLSILSYITSFIVLWGELFRIASPNNTIFHLISHLNLSELNEILFVNTIFLSYQIFIGSWSLTRLRIGSFFRFVEGSTSAYTLYYWSVFICRLIPTICFHYLTQINATKSQFVSVMGSMDKIPFLGRSLVKFSPMLLLIIVLFVIFNLWNKILLSFGLKKFTLKNRQTTETELEKGETVLRNTNFKVNNILNNNPCFCINPYQKETIDHLVFKF